MQKSTLFAATILFFGPRIQAADLALGELGAAAFTSGWKTAQVDQSVAGLPLKIGSQAFAHGIGVHAPSAATIKLDGKAKSFRAQVGVNTDGHNEQGSVEFLVTGDGKTLWRSGILRGGDAPKAVDVPLAGVRKLTLEVTDGGDGKDSDHGNWAEAVISYEGAKPVVFDSTASCEPTELYPPVEKLVSSPGNTTYYVDPNRGSDSNTGTAASSAWKSIARVNAMKFAAGDRVRIAPGLHAETLRPSGQGTKEKPVVIEFLPGRHEFGSEEILARPFFISNSCDDPQIPKPVAILMTNVRHFRVEGGGVDGKGRTDIVLLRRMAEIINDHAEDIAYSGFTMDLQRPTISELRCLETSPNTVTVQVAEGSTYEIKDGRFEWTGDLGRGGSSFQDVDLETSQCRRFGGVQFGKAEDLGGGKVRFTYETGTGGFVKNHQYHFRFVTRDSVGVHNTRSKDIVFHDCEFHNLTNMGFVSQFTENLTYLRVNVGPPKGTIRTCAAHADIFQFSNCKGEARVESCHLSGMQDDAINCHGTHLRIIDKPAENQLLLRFMHPQTYGFAAYIPGDEVAVVNHANLREYADNPRRKVTAVEKKTEKDWLITLDGPAPRFEKDDVIDNVTWYPDLTAINNHISVDPVRGFLITTRGKSLVEGNTFYRCAMPGILIEDDAEGWFESGPVRDLTIRNNTFVRCGIHLNPMSKSKDPAEPVHENIRIENNRFEEGAGISAHHVKGLVILNNRTTGDKLPIDIAPTCTEVKIEGTATKVK